jgi:hypothetical protein
MQRETEAMRAQTDAMDAQLRELKAAMGDTHVALTAAKNVQTRTAAEVKEELASARAASHAAARALAQVIIIISTSQEPRVAEVESPQSRTMMAHGA